MTISNKLSKCKKVHVNARLVQQKSAKLPTEISINNRIRGVTTKNNSNT